MRKKKKMSSFTKFSRKCKDHQQDEETKKCFCDVKGGTCCLVECPNYPNGYISKEA